MYMQYDFISILYEVQYEYRVLVFRYCTVQCFGKHPVESEPRNKSEASEGGSGRGDKKRHSARLVSDPTRISRSLPS